MAVFQSPPLRIAVFPTQFSTIRTQNLILFPKIPVRTYRISLSVLAWSAPKRPVPATEQDILEAISESDGSDVPGVRTYENDLARLTVVGPVDFEQALTAAAADGGKAAEEHITSGIPVMVAETLFPGSPDDHSTIATRLFLPAEKVKGKAKKLKKYLTKDILSSTTSTNILAMTFRQVVLQQLWNFELLLFRPGTKRNMEDLENARNVPVSFTFSSSDEWAISVLAEVVSLSAFRSAERNFFANSIGRSSDNLFRLFHKPERIALKDSSFILYKFLEDELVGNAKSLLKEFNSTKAHYKPVTKKSKLDWWTSSVYTKLEKIGGSEFSTWVCEYVPAYRLQIDSDKLEKLKFKGWKKSAENRWEVLMTHSQMVCLANVLDMYYEDLFTLPNKHLPCGGVAKSTSMSTNKGGSFLLKLLSVILMSGIFVVTITVLRQLYLPRLYNGQKFPRGDHSLKSSHIDSIQHQPVESTKLEDFCVLIVRKVKDTFDWPGEIRKGSGCGAWTGELPEYLRTVVQADLSNVDISSAPAPSCKNDEDMRASAQDIASYQVVLSGDGKIVGFQPTSRVAVNHWATNPLAKEMYGGRKLSPGFLEPGLKIKRPPSEVVVLELLMSENPESYFALARPVNL